MFLGTQALAAPIWGLVTQYADLRTALLAAAALLVVSLLFGRVLRVPDSQGLDRSPLAYWDTPRLQVDPSISSGPVVVAIQYEVTDPNPGRFPRRDAGDASVPAPVPHRAQPHQCRDDLGVRMSVGIVRAMPRRSHTV